MRPTVVLIDDHDSFRRGARRLLAAAGYDVVGEAATAGAGIAAAQQLLPDVVIVDVMLPDGSGFDVVARLADKPTRPRMVLISSRSAEDFGDRVASSPADAFITKADLSAQVLSGVLG